VFPRCVVVWALTIIHGEADSLAGTSQATYERDLPDWQRDFNIDMSSMTGQSSQVLEFTDQMNSYTSTTMSPPRSTSVIPLAQLQTALDYPASVFLVGPKYFLTYTTDGVHLTASSEQLLGEYYGKADKQTVIDGVPWKPLYPTAFVISGRFINVTFNVPVPPLVLDRILVFDPGNAGFAYTEDSDHPPSDYRGRVECGEPGTHHAKPRAKRRPRQALSQLRLEGNPEQPCGANDWTKGKFA
jgi:hypothetical protein